MKLNITPRYSAIKGCSDMDLDNLPCLPEPSFMASIYNQLFEDVQNERLKQVKRRLAEMGYLFSDMNMLKKWLPDNATIISYDDKPNYRELYLFYGTRDQVIVGAWWETYDFVPSYYDPENGYKMTVIAGKPPIA